jgi:hypothetical protein
VAKRQSSAALRAAGFRATTAYNYPEAGMTQAELWAAKAPYASMVGGFEAEWKKTTAPGSLPYIVPVSPGWDSRPWYLDSALVRTDPRPELFRRMCERARRYVDPALRMVIAECWNEFGEGSYVEPTEQTGFGALDAMRDAFCPGNAPHADVTPRGVGRPAPAWAWDELPAASADELMAMGANMLWNGDMERPWGWVDFQGAPAELVAEAHGGARSLRAPAAGGAKTEWVMPVPPSRQARVAVWAKVPDGTKLRVMAALFRGGSWLAGRYAPIGEVQATGGEWKAFEWTVSTEEAEATGLDVEFVADGAGALVDDVSVTAVPKARETPPVPAGVKPAAERLAAGEDLLHNGGFEADWGWILFDNKTPAGRTAQAHAGRSALALQSGQGAKTLWLMPLPASRQARVELWAKVPKAAALFVSAAAMRDGTWLGRYARILQVAGDGGRWREYSGPMAMEDPIANEFDIEFVAQGGECLVDDVSVHAVGR